MSMKSMRRGISFAVRCCQFLSMFPDGHDELWKADVKAWRQGGGECRVFDGVLFYESNGTAAIFGIESEDGRPKELAPELASKQHDFIEFLREETRQQNLALGVMSRLFQGHKYANEAKATAAYISHRGTPHVMGIGYRTDVGNYELIGIDLSDDKQWLETAQATLSFDELDRH